MLHEVEKGEQRSVPNNLIVDHPSEELANLIGNKSTSTRRTKTKGQKPDIKVKDPQAKFIKANIAQDFTLLDIPPEVEADLSGIPVMINGKIWTKIRLPRMYDFGQKQVPSKKCSGTPLCPSTP